MFSLLLVVGCVSAAPVPKDALPAAEPEWMKKFRETYELKPGEYVKRVAAPYIAERIDFNLDAFGPPKYPEADARNREQEKKHGKWLTTFVEQDGRALKRRFTTSSVYLADEPRRQRGDNVFEVSSAVARVTGLSSPEFIVDPAHKDDPLFEKENLTVHGDFVVRKNAPLDKLAVQLEAILRKECSVPVTLRVDQVEQDVFVTSGTFELKPPAWRRDHASKRLQKLIDVYATDEGLNPSYDHFDFESRKRYQGRAESNQYSGTPADFVRFVGQRLGTRMVWDRPLPAEPKFSWCNHTLTNPTDQEKADDRDPDKVLKNVTDQTGLQFKKERRKVPVLVIAPADKK